MSMYKVTVVAPASSANLGPGYDAIGVAFDLYDMLTFELLPSGLEFEGCPAEYCNEDNLSYRAFKAVYDEAGETFAGLRIKETSTEIPMSGGLGSSAAMIAAGVTAANELLGCPFDRKKRLEICLRFEPHPDNISACVYGGLTTAFRTGPGAAVLKTPVDSSIRFYAVITEQRVVTEEARAIMPEKIDISESASNTAKAAMIPSAFKMGDRELIGEITQDTIHTPYRKGLIDDYDAVRSIAFRTGAYAYFISGSGSTCIAMSDSETFQMDLEAALAEAGIERRILSLGVDGGGARKI